MSKNKVKKDFDKKAKTYGEWFKNSVGTKYIDQLEKEAIIKLMNKNITQDKNLAIAEIGAGNGRVAKHLTNKLDVKNYLAIDFSEKMVKELRQLRINKLEAINANGTNFKLKKKADLIISIRQIKYNKNYHMQLRNMKDNLKSGGMILIEFPCSLSVSKLRNLLFDNDDVLFNPESVIYQLSKLGFKEIEFKALRYLPDNFYIYAKNKFSLKLLIGVEKILNSTLPPVFAKSAITTAKKHS